MEGGALGQEAPFRPVGGGVREQGDFRGPKRACGQVGAPGPFVDVGLGFGVEMGRECSGAVPAFRRR